MKYKIMHNQKVSNPFQMLSPSKMIFLLCSALFGTSEVSRIVKQRNNSLRCVKFPSE